MSIHISRKYVLAATGSILALCVMPIGVSYAQSESHALLSSKFTFDAGVFFTDSEFDLTVKGSVPLDPSEPIDFSKSLNSNADEEIGSFQFTWRFGEKWSLSGQYISFDSRGRSAVLEEDVEWGDITFGAGTGIAAGTDTTISRVFFGRTFKHRNDNSEFGFGFGGHIIEVGAFIAGNAIINGEPVGAREERVRTSGILPDIGVWYIHSFSKKWAFKARLDWLGASIDKYDGHIANVSVGINYQMFKHFGVGLNYNILELDVSITEDLWKGSMLNRSEGLFAHVSAYW